MSRIAFIMGDQFLYWNAIILMMAALCSILMFWALQLRADEQRKGTVLTVALSLLLSLTLSRLVHWYCRPQGYSSLGAALGNLRDGGFALIGAFAGCMLSALLVRLFGIYRNTPALLDRMAVAGCLGISVGRLADLFTTADRGMPLSASIPMPWATTLYNPVSGETEVRLAVFMLQSMFAALLFAVLLVYYFRGRKNGTTRDGDTALLFLLCYCASQAVLDSPRYDSLYFRSNGFVSVVQIASILTVIAVLVIYTIRLFRAGQSMKFLVPFMTIPLLVVAAYMEYHVQRHGGQALYSYTVMSISMGLSVLLGLLTRYLADRPSRKNGFPASEAEPEWEA